MRWACPLAVDDLVEVVRIADVGRAHARLTHAQSPERTAGRVLTGTFFSNRHSNMPLTGNMAFPGLNVAKIEALIKAGKVTP
jgi:hypothetical protein